MKFTYTATNKVGKTVHGSAEGVNREAVLSLLHKQDLRPIVIKADSGLGKIKGRARHIKSRDLVIFTRQLSTMISAGVPITRCLTTLQEQSESKYFKVVINDITKEVEGGTPLGDAFSKY